MGATFLTLTATLLALLLLAPPAAARRPTADAPMTLAEIEEALQKHRGGRLVVVSWGGAYQRAQTQAFFDRFSKQFGIRMIQESPTDLARIVAMVDSRNVTWDVVDVESREPEFLGPAGYLEELDYSIIDGRFTPGPAKYPWAIGNIFWSTVLVYDEKAFPAGGPQSWKDFWDVKRFPGPRSLRNHPYGNLVFALLADGVPPDKIYPMTDEMVDRAFKKLDQIKPHITVWWTAGSQPAELLSRREVVMTSAYNGRIFEIQQEGVPARIVWNGGHASIDFWVIPKGAPNRELAQLFVAWATIPENQAQIARYITYGPPDRRAWDHVDPNWAPVKAGLPSDPENLKVQAITDGMWWGKNLDKLLERWNEWILR